MTTKEATVKPNREQRRAGLATIKEACDFLTVGHVTVYAMIRDGQLASTKIRNARRVPWEALYRIADEAMNADSGVNS
jgi:excisionase family DNA binding protein